MKAGSSPDSILNQLGITEPSEIDLEAIAFYCGTFVEYRKLDGCAARIIGKDDQGIISVDSACSPERQRFSVAHELGHWMYDRGGTYQTCQVGDITSVPNSIDREKRANQFAADLLMPNSMFKPRAKNRPISFNTVNDLAGEFCSSRTATAIRLVQLGSLPGMVVCFGQSGRKWFQRGPYVPNIFYPLKELSHDTEAFEVLFSNVTQHMPTLADAGSWIDRPDAGKYTVMEHSIKIGEDVLTLLWWKNEAQIEDAS